MVVWGDKPLCEGVTIIGLSTAKNKALLGLEGDLLPYESYGKPRLLTYKWPSCTRRKLVHLQEIARTYHYECQPKVFGYSFEIIDNQMIHLCIFSPQVTMAKSQWMMVMDKFSSSVSQCATIYNISTSPLPHFYAEEEWGWLTDHVLVSKGQNILFLSCTQFSPNSPSFRFFFY